MNKGEEQGWHCTLLYMVYAVVDFDQEDIWWQAPL